MSDNNGTNRGRPAPSKVAAMTASADAMTPLSPANAAKSRTNAVPCRSRPETGASESVGSDLFIGPNRCCLAPKFPPSDTPTA